MENIIKSWKSNFCQNITVIGSKETYQIGNAEFKDVRIIGCKVGNDIIPHNLNGPSIIVNYPNSNKPKLLFYARNGLLQSVNNQMPARIMLSEDGKISRYLHINNKGVRCPPIVDNKTPTLCHIDSNDVKLTTLYNNERGQLHRDPKEGPARETRNATDQQIVVDYMINGRHHRKYEDGPALLRYEPITGVLLVRGFYEYGQLFAPFGSVCQEKFYINGKLEEVTTMIKLSGLKFFCTNGTTKDLTFYRNEGQYLCKKKYDQEGKLKFYTIHTLSNTLLFKGNYDNDGQLRFIDKYVYLHANDDVLVGKDMYDKNDVHISSIRSFQGIKDIRKTYHANGNVKQKNILYNKRLLDETLLTHGKILVTKVYAESGEVIERRYFTSHDGKYRLISVISPDNVETVLVEYDTLDEMR